MQYKNYTTMAKIEIETPKGNIVVRLYDDTPKHRDNMLKLIDEGFYNGTLFHRVIKDFMIQAGDPDSKGAPAGKHLGAGGPDYTIEAEIKSNLFHKRGALCAARLGDEVNPNKESSGSQFYIVWGDVYNTAQLKQMEKQMKQNQEITTFNDLVTYHKDKIMEMRRNRDRVGLQELQDCPEGGQRDLPTATCRLYRGAIQHLYYNRRNTFPRQRVHCIRRGRKRTGYRRANNKCRYRFCRPS